MQVWRHDQHNIQSEFQLCYACVQETRGDLTGSQILCNGLTIV